MILPKPAAKWVAASSFAAAVSYADRGTSAIAASGILEELKWTESELGGVQSAFFLGYGLTQVLGGLLAESSSSRGGNSRRINGGNDAYRSVLPTSIFLTGVATMCFPTAASLGGPMLASVDRFALGVCEGLLLPSAMSGLSSLVPSDRRGTASSILIASCYLGSALAYLSAYIIFSLPPEDPISHWSSVFYVNGLLAFVSLFLFRDEFDMPRLLQPESFLENSGTSLQTPTDDNIVGESRLQTILSDARDVTMATLSSPSGRAILAAQFGQGALLYSLASWGPLYLERIEGAAAASSVATVASTVAAAPGAKVAAAAAAASLALIPAQLTQAIVGVGVGSTSDALTKRIGTATTRRILQATSGVVPGLILWYLSSPSASSGVDQLVQPAFLFGVAQTVSALSLGAVSVSHLEVAPRNAGTVYALGNVAAAISGAGTVNICGMLLESGGGSDFSVVWRLVATISIIGSITYALTIKAEPEIFIKSDKECQV
mmetsp:Transcript_30609/g.44992  ORF Transcript_30609/g.44992 Transcript_30609/m.44992 type:complete len:491 (+) Transcript_30609:39-1511(+)